MRIALGLVLIFTAVSLSAQQFVQDTVKILKGIEISATRMQSYMPGVKTEALDTLLQQMKPFATIANLLTEHSGALVRSYSTGGLATVSIRGTLSAHSGVLWNGFNLNQPNVGMTDLSLIPSALFEKVEIQSGGAAAIAGSGLIGGLVNLSSSPEFNTGYHYKGAIGMGSYGEYHSLFRFNAGGKGYSTETSLVGVADKNQYRFTDLSGNRITLEHAAMTNVAALNQSTFRIGKRGLLNTGLWLQRSDREIPPTLVMQSNDQEQKDQSIRGTAQYTLTASNWRYQARTAWFREIIHFTSPRAMIDAYYLLRTYALETDFRREFRTYSLNLGATARLQHADVPYYETDNRKVPGGAVFASVLYHPRNFPVLMALNLRKEWEKEFIIPLTPSLSLESKFSKRFIAKLNISRNYRVPTLNDRFWIPGGNPDLLPESSWNEELNLAYLLTSPEARSGVNIGFSLYNIKVSNLIQWISTSATLWSPQNVSRVWSRGIEADIMFYNNLQRGVLRSQVKYGYWPSTMQLAGDNSGNQLIYIPLHRISMLTDLSIHSYNFLVSAVANGKRFVNQSNTEDLPWYTLINFALQKAVQVRNVPFHIQVEIVNLLNVEYQVVKYYPEPGTSLNLSLIINL